jgi:hypothetical protein
MSFQTPLLTRRAAAVTVAIGFTLALAGARADDSSEAMTHAAGAGSKVIRTTVQYTIPQVRLVRDDGKSVSLPDEMNDGRPVVLNFVFTTCGSICPLMSQIFGQFQQRMAKQGGDVHLMSISTIRSRTRRSVCASMQNSSELGPRGSTIRARCRQVRPHRERSTSIVATR